MIRILAFFALWLVQTTIDQYSALVGTTLTRGRTATNQSIGSGATINMDASVGPYDVLTVLADMTAGVVGDLAVQVFPYEADGLTVSAVPLAPVTGAGGTATFTGGHSYYDQQFNVQGLDKVRIAVKNNNAGAQTLNASWRVD